MEKIKSRFVPKLFSQQACLLLLNWS